MQLNIVEQSVQVFGVTAVLRAAFVLHVRQFVVVPVHVRHAASQISHLFVTAFKRWVLAHPVHASTFETVLQVMQLGSSKGQLNTQLSPAIVRTYGGAHWQTPFVQTPLKPHQFVHRFVQQKSTNTGHVNVPISIVLLVPASLYEHVIVVPLVNTIEITRVTRLQVELKHAVKRLKMNVPSFMEKLPSKHLAVLS